MRDVGKLDHVGERILVLTPTSRDGEMTRSLLTEAGSTCVVCPDPESLSREVARGCGCVLLTEEALLHEDYERLAESLRDQAPWSDLPVIVLTRGGADSPLAARAIDTLGNVIVLEQPVRVSTLVSAVRMALRARSRQYQIREHLEERKHTEQALREADRRKDEFLAMLAHELRNPLSAISSAIQLSLRPANDEDLVWSKSVIDRQTKHLARLIDDLLDVSRITQGKIQLRMERLDLGEIIHRAVEAVRPFLDKKQHHLTVSVMPGPMPVLADPTRMEQVFVNLLTNAAKYSEDGGHITLTCHHDGEVIVSVKDDGMGIPPEALPHIFDLFAQADRTIDRSQGGLGIGLTLARSLVEMHGGTITAASPGVGQGSEFTIRLPVAADLATEPARPRPEPHTRPGKGLRVLVVDDNRDTAIGMEKLLRASGYEVRTAHDGIAAIAEARAGRPDVVLMDIGLPGMDGYEVAQHLRRDERCKNAVLIAISGYGQEQDRRRSVAAGFDHHLVKPVEYDSLLSLLAAPRPAGS